MLACKTHQCQVGKEVKRLPSGEGGHTVRPPRPHPLTHFLELWEAMRQTHEGYKRSGCQPLAVRAHHQRTLTTSHVPTTGGPQPPAQRPLLIARVVISFHLFLLLLFSPSLNFLAHKGYVVCLSTCCILWFCEIRHGAVETFCQVNIRFQHHCANSNIMKLQRYHLL